MTPLQLWIDYLGNGGNATSTQLQRWIDHSDPMPCHDYNVAAQALNDVFSARGEAHAIPYSETL